MPTRENLSGIGVFSTFGPATVAATGAGVAVDTAGFDSATLLIAIGAGGITLHAGDPIDIVLEEADDNAHWPGVSQGEVQASYGTSVIVGTGGIVRTINSAHPAADAKPTKVGYIGSSRYLRAFPMFTGTHGTGTPIDLKFVLGNAHIKPVA